MRRGPIADMSAPQRDVLAAVAANRTVDRADVSDTLSTGESPISHRMVYRHLESLVEKGLVEKQSGGCGIRNQYRIARDGLRTLHTHRAWVNECLDDAAPIVEVQK